MTLPAVPVVPYEVKSGDNLNNIGREYGMSYHFVNMLRGKDVEDGNIRPGDRLKIFNLKQVGYDMHISKSEFIMDLFIGGIFAAVSTSATVRISPQPPPAPPTLPPANSNPSGQTQRPIGSTNTASPATSLAWYRMAFDGKIDRNGLGIHGYTGDGQATGVKSSNGCIRAENDEATLLYHILVPCATIRGEFITRAPMSVTIVD